MMKFGSLLLFTPLLVMAYTQMETSVTRKDAPEIKVETKSLNVNTPEILPGKLTTTRSESLGNDNSIPSDGSLDHKLRFNRLSLLTL